eukprot:7041840-Prymnesium_polylepis.1
MRAARSGCPWAPPPARRVACPAWPPRRSQASCCCRHPSGHQGGARRAAQHRTPLWRALRLRPQPQRPWCPRQGACLRSAQRLRRACLCRAPMGAARLSTRRRGKRGRAVAGRGSRGTLHQR